MKTTAVSCLPRPPDIIRAQCPEAKTTTDGKYPYIGYQFAELPYYIPFLSDYLWKLNNMLFMTFSWIYTDLVDFRAEAEVFIHCYDYATSDYGIWSFTKDGIYVGKWTTPSWNQENNMCVDSSYNVYMTDVAGGSWNVLKKWDKIGTLLVTKTTDYTHGIAISPDGYLYTRQLDGGDEVIVKRDPDDLAAISQIAMTTCSREFTFDSDGYFYIREKVGADWGIGKWDYGTETRIAHHAASFDTNLVSFAYANSLIGFCCGDEAVYTIPTSLDENQTSWSWGAIHIAARDDNFILAESTDSGGYYGLAQYTSGGVLDWTKQVGHYDDVISYGVAAYPF